MSSNFATVAQFGTLEDLHLEFHFPMDAETDEAFGHMSAATLM
ncbi:MAG: hypothetical protein AAF679_05985 [Pseudomonadota bacterium]